MFLGATFCQNIILYRIPIEMIHVFIKRLWNFYCYVKYIQCTDDFADLVTFKTVTANISEATATLTDATGAHRICIVTSHGIRTETIRRTICNED